MRVTVDPGWVPVAGPMSGTGPATFVATLDPNPLPFARTDNVWFGAISIEFDQTYDHDQCSYTLLEGTAIAVPAPNTDYRTLHVETVRGGTAVQDGCAWAAVVTSGADFLTIDPVGVGSGTGVFRFRYANNPPDRPERHGTIEVRQPGSPYFTQVLTVTQEGTLGDPGGGDDGEVPTGSADEGAVSYYHLDALGSVRAITDAAGAVVVRHDYQPFGVEWAPQSATGDSPVRFAGKERDPETGTSAWGALDYSGARYFEANLGRFLRADDPGFGDPSDPQSMNLYGYAYNNPLRWTDPTGHEPECPTAYCQSITVTAPAFDLGLFRFLASSFEIWPPAMRALPRDTEQAPQQSSAGLPAPTSFFEVDKLVQCASDQLGLTDLLAVGFIAAGQPVPGTKRFVTPGSSRGTSVAGKMADRLFGSRRLGARLPTIVGGPGTGRVLAIAGTKSVARFAGRAVPLIGWAMLVYDAASIAACAAR